MKSYIILAATALILASCGTNDNAGEKMHTAADSSMAGGSINNQDSPSVGSKANASDTGVDATSANGTTPYNGGNAPATAPGYDTTNLKGDKSR
jgi:hypothetical protein